MAAKKRPSPLPDDPRFLHACVERACVRVDYAALSALTGYSKTSCRKALAGNPEYHLTLAAILKRLGLRASR